MIEIEYCGQMTSGKNAQGTAWPGGRKVTYPKARFKNWRAEFQHQVQRQVYAQLYRNPLRGGVLFPAGVAVAFRVHYWPGDRRRRDMPGMLDAIWHAAEKKHGGLLVIDDSQFTTCLGWTPHAPDKGHPRLHLHLEPAPTGDLA